MLRLVRRIGEAVLELQQSGKVKYIGWSMSVSCIDPECNKKTLHTIAKKMEVELVLWREEVDNARKQFYPLNYYTMNQLLELREELGKLKANSSSCVLTPHALTLLQSISSEASLELISKAVKSLSSLEPSFSDIDSCGPQNFENWRAPLDSETQADDEVSSTASTYVSLALTSPGSEDDEQQLSLLKFDQCQLEIYCELTDYYGYPEDLAEEAVTVCEDLDIDRAIEWCDDHADEFEVQHKTTSVGDNSTELHNRGLERTQAVDLPAVELTNESKPGEPSATLLSRLESFEMDR